MMGSRRLLVWADRDRQTQGRNSGKHTASTSSHLSGNPTYQELKQFANRLLPVSPSSARNRQQGWFSDFSGQANHKEFHSVAAGTFARNSRAAVTSGRSASALFQSVRNWW